MQITTKNLLFCIVILLGIPTRLTAQPREFNLKSLTGFYLNEKIPLEKGLNFKVISNRKEFIKHFGLINKPDTPNFSKHHVIVMALPPTKEQWFLNFETKAYRAGNYLEVYCDIKHDKHKITYIDYPIVTAAIPRFFRVNTVNFYDRESRKLLASVPIP